MIASDSPVLGKAHTPHLSELDGFRGLSILAVLAAHMLPLGPEAWEGNSTAGYMGMSVFFALSGFLIAQFLWQNSNVGTFFIRRLARIVPLVLLVSIVYCLILDARPDSFLAVNTYTLNYWHSAISPSISPLWSLGVEMQFYLSIGLSVLFFGRTGFWMVPLGAAAVMGFRVAHGVFGAIPTHLRVDEILAGSMLAIIWLNRDHPRLSPIWHALPGAFWPLFVLWCLSCWPPTQSLGYFRPYLTAAMIGSVLAMDAGWQRTFLSGRALRYIAAVSFALYVWHSPFRHGWWDAGPDLERYLLKRPLAFAAIFALAHASTVYFERPITRAARDWTRRRAATAKSLNAG